MKVIYTKEYLRDLHLFSKTCDKKYRFQPSIIKRYIKVIDLMIETKNIFDLSRINSLRYEKLTGNKKGLSSVRVSDKYRLEFKEEIADGEEIASICNIIELSNHYK